MTTNTNINAQVDDCVCASGCQCLLPDVIDYGDVIAESVRSAVIWTANAAVLGLVAVGIHAMTEDSPLTWLESLSLYDIVGGAAAIGAVVGVVTAIVLSRRVRSEDGGDR